MRRRVLAILPAAALVLVALAASPADATTKNFSFTMDLRYVNGKNNGVLYEMNEGDMTLSGDIWAYDKHAGALPNPFQVTINVRREVFGADPVACTALRTPSNTLDVKRGYAKDCGWEPTDAYYIEAYTTTDDGWDVKSTGTIRTS